MEEKCDIGSLLDKPCHKKDYTRQIGIKRLLDLSLDDQDILLWRAGLIDSMGKRENKSICLHHEKLFGEVFARKTKENDKCCEKLKSHNRKVKGEKIYIFSILSIQHCIISQNSFSLTNFIIWIT